MTDLPDGWEWAKIGDLASSIGNGRSVPDGPDDGYLVLRLTAIRSGQIDVAACKKGAWTAKEANSFRIRKDDLLIARGNGSKHLVGRGGIVREDSEIAFPDTMIRIRFDETKIHPKYAALIWDSPQIRTQIESRARTTAGIYKVSQKDLREISISLPPRDEQSRIAAAIEEQFSRLDAGITALRRASVNLRRMRRSVLQSAMGSTNLPDGWRRVTIGSICECLDSRRVPVSKNERIQRTGDIPYYGANGQTGWIDAHLFDEPLVLVVEDETFTGREKAFSYKITGKSWVNNHAHVLRPRPGVNVDYLNYALAYYPFTPLTTGTTGRRKLTQKALLTAPLMLPPEPEQEELVLDVDRQISAMDHLGAEVDAWLIQSSACHRSILQHAFFGKLTSPEVSA